FEGSDKSARPMHFHAHQSIVPEAPPCRREALQDIEAGFDSKRPDQRFPAIMGQNPSPDRTSMGLQLPRVSHLDPILFPRISFGKRDGFSFRLTMSMSTSTSLSKSPRAHP